MYVVRLRMNVMSFSILCVFMVPPKWLKEVKYGTVDTLRAFIWSHSEKLVILGDFNQLENSNQKMGGNSIIPGAPAFTQWNVDCNLMDLPFYVVNFTSTNNRDNGDTIFERLDRAYCND